MINHSPKNTPPTTQPSIALSAENISVTLGTNLILDQVSLAFEAGTCTAIVGPNGAGKSTLFGVLAGDIKPDSGQIQLMGAPLESLSPLERAQKRAVQLQKSQMAFAFTVFDAVMMGRSPWRKTPRSEYDLDVVNQALTAAEVDHLSDRFVPVLSGGENARVAFARLLAQETPVVLLDEPTAALDIRHQERVAAQAKKLAQEGACVIIIVHDLSLAAAYADRVVLLAAGNVIADGEPKTVLTAAKVSEIYEHPVQVLNDPLTGNSIFVPVRTPQVTPNSPIGGTGYEA